MMMCAWVGMLLGSLLGTVSTQERDPWVRPSLTLLLGTDEDPSIPAYRLAEAYFREDPHEATAQVAGPVSSLREVRNYLEAQHPPQGLPWGVINLVVHGTDLGALDIPLEPGEGRVSHQRLGEALRLGTFQPLANEVVDARTELRIHGCAAGRDRRLLALMSRAFGGEDGQRPVVKASPFYTCFQSTGSPLSQLKRTLCEVWEVTFRPGERPSKDLLAARFRAKYSRTSMDFGSAVAHEAPRFLGDPFHMEMPVSFRWVAVFRRTDQVPVFPGRVHQRSWLVNQEAFREAFRITGIPFDALYWEIRPTRHAFQGSELPALEVLGLGRKVLCLRALEADGKADPGVRWQHPDHYTIVF